ncbi:MAG: zinc-dependent alcohol dehydrogenase [Ruminococcus sp.]|jgi:2-desacetyl-2-hydroxyethyl bacteriochlorophyllide A dehydrogenase
MRAAIYNGKQKITLAELDMPAAGDNDIVVRNLYASICGTDVAVYTHGPGTGHRITVGEEFGHEMVSEVVQVGKKVKGIHVGDRVYPYPRLAKGDPKRAGTVGGFSEYILIPDAKLYQQVYPVSEKISSKTASLIEPFTVGCRAARRTAPVKGEKGVVFGAGTIGMAAAIALKYFGCEKVMICDHSDFRLQIAEKLGFQTCNNEKENLREKAVHYFGKAPGLKGETADADIYIDAAGADSILETFQDMGKIGSRMAVVAVRAGKRPVDILSMTYAQQSLIGSGGYLPEDVKDVMNIMESGRWDIESMITHEYPWEKLPEAIEKAGQVNEALNVVINYRLKEREE